MKKIRAFTITELMVVCLLTVVTVGMAMAAWQIMEKQYFQYEEETGYALELGQIQMLLERDFMQARVVTRKEQSLRFSYAQYEVLYRFENNEISRQLEGSSRKDVFPFPVAKWETYFQRIPIELGTIDFIQLQTQLFERPVTLVFSKKYSSEELMNLNYAG